MTFPTGEVLMLSGNISDTNKLDGQGRFWFAQLFQQRFELVATASASDTYW